jgi:polysaccharide biosynthesis transport protein
MQRETDVGRTDVVTLSDYLDVIRRRKWIILLTAILFAIPAVLLSSRGKSTYEATASLIPAQHSFVASAVDPSSVRSSQDADRAAQTQADLARAPELIDRVLSAAGVPDLNQEVFLKQSSVVPAGNADLLEFNVRDADPELTVTLANTYAREFASYRRELDAAAFERARDRIAQSIRQVEGELEQAQSTESPGSVKTTVLIQRYTSLVNRAEELNSTEALSAQELVAVPAREAVEHGPQPVRNGVLAFGLGLLLGTVLAFIREAMDTRLRSADQIGQSLGLPLLGRLAPPPASLRQSNGLVMLEAPTHPQAEAFRMLRANLDHANPLWDARTIMFAGACEGEGRTTTIANLGIAFARAGRRLILVDLDLRKPGLASLFGVENEPGITDVAMGRLDLVDALVSVPIEDTRQDDDSMFDGRLQILPAGHAPPHVGDFVGSPALADIMAQLRERSELVLIDVPPLLEFGDGVVLSANVDALVVVVGLDAVRQEIVDELERVLEIFPAAKLGYVLTGVPDTGQPYTPGAAARDQLAYKAPNSNGAGRVGASRARVRGGGAHEDTATR